MEVPASVSAEKADVFSIISETENLFSSAGQQNIFCGTLPPAEADLDTGSQIKGNKAASQTGFPDWVPGWPAAGARIHS